MTTVFIGEHIGIPSFADGDREELASLALSHEEAVIALVEEREDNRQTEAPPIGPWQDLMRREVAIHYCEVGLEDEARVAQGRISHIGQEDAFEVQMSMWVMFGYEEDHARLRTIPDTTNHEIYQSKQKLQVVRHDTATGHREDIEAYAETIPLETERTLARIVLANTIAEVSEINEQYPFVSQLLHGGDERTDKEYNNGLARVTLGAAMKGLEVHQSVLDTLTVLTRPDAIKNEVHDYIKMLLQQGKPEEVEAVVDAISRDGHYNVEFTRIFMAQQTQTESDVTTALEVSRRVTNDYVRAHLLHDLVGLHVDMGKMDEAETLVAEIGGGFSGSTVEFDKSKAYLELFRGYLQAGDTEAARRAYKAAMYIRHRSNFVSGRLMLARYLRTGNPGPVNLSF